jgi:NAD(P)-dependent dehydrogenase (short-subunit alcohol dehydrogenase family)
MASLTNTIALVTGASRGVGKGIALGLGEAGATVYVTGRTSDQHTSTDSGSIEETAAEVTRLGGQGIPVRCDHRNDTEVEALFTQIQAEQRRLDLLVNNIWGGYEQMSENGEWTWERPFWEQPVWRWEAMFHAGVRAHFIASRLAAPLMMKQRSGLIVTISFWAAQKHMGNLIYGMAKAATDKFAADSAEELRPYDVASVSLYPGMVRTEAVLANAEWLDLSNSESPQFVGRAVAALASDPAKMQRSGHILLTAQLAQEYGFVDIDGKIIRPLTLVEA